jgi:3',5'-cyclic AMP phosphodiesterase CpdA
MKNSSWRRNHERQQEKIMLTIAQITDLHVTTDKDPLNQARNADRLRQVLKSIHALVPRPAAIIASGDLADHGTPEEYEALKDILREAQIPIHFGLGNHDRRQTFRAAFSGVPVDANGFVQYAVEIAGLRLVMCDTLEEGAEGGGFCEARAAWLKQTLDDAPGMPTLVVLHHPPIASGIQWMDEPPGTAWMSRLALAIRDRKQILTLACGHMHRAYHGLFAGQLVSVSPASSIQLTLNLSPVDKRVPDGREILVEEPPGYTLFAWDRNALAVHVCVAGDFAPAVTYTRPFSAA